MKLNGLEKWKNRGQGSRFSIYFELSNIPNTLPRITKDSFIFNSVPAINLFTYQMEPVNLDHKTEKISLRPNAQHPNHYQVYDVDSVIGYRAGGTDKKVYQPMSTFKGIKSGQPVYQLIRGRSIINNAPDASLFFPYQDPVASLSTETLSITLTCTNGRLTERVKVGDICQPTFNSPESLSFRNITQPTYSIEPPSDVVNLWRFISHLSMNFLSIANLQNIKELLKLYVSTMIWISHD
jgi:type VI secretion system protein ImpG